MPLVLARPSGRGGFGRRAGPEDFGGGEGQYRYGSGLMDAGQALGQIGAIAARVYDVEQRARAARASADAARELGIAAEGVVTSTADHHAWLGAYDERRAEIVERLGKDLPAVYRELFDADAADYDTTLQAKLRSAVRVRSVAQADADLKAALATYADEEARATTPIEAERWRAKSAGLIAQARAGGIWDQADEDQAAEAYETSVWKAALAKGIAADPAATLAALEARVGPFAPMHEEDRQAAILTATKSIKALERSERSAERAERSALRFAQGQQDRALREAARSASEQASALAVRGELTSEAMAQLRPALSSEPATLRHFDEVLAAGGRYSPGPPDPAYYQELMLERATNRSAYATRVLDPVRAGTMIEEIAKDQSDVRGGAPSFTDSYRVKVDERITQAFKDPSWSPFYGEPDAALQGQFRVMADEAKIAFVAQAKREPDDVEAARLLDGVQLSFVRRFGAGSLEGLTGRGALFPAAGTGVLLPVIRPEVRQQIEASLRAGGRAVTDENVRTVYEQGVAAGLIVP